MINSIEQFETLWGYVLPQKYKELVKSIGENDLDLLFNQFDHKKSKKYGTNWAVWGIKELNLLLNNGFYCFRLRWALDDPEEVSISNVGTVNLKLMRDGFSFGVSDGDLIFINPHDNNAIWIWNHDDGSFFRAADSFDVFLKYAVIN